MFGLYSRSIEMEPASSEVTRAMRKTLTVDTLDDARAGVMSQIHHLSGTVRALSHEQRLAILVYLCNKECSVGELERKLDLPQPAVSQQLARLRSDGLVMARRDGRTIYYCADRERLGDFLACLGRLLA